MNTSATLGAGTCFAPALHLPLPFGMSEKPTTTRLRPQRRAEAEDAARVRGWSLSRFIEWCTDQVLALEFLDAVNRDFVIQLRQQLGKPFTEFDVINQLVTRARLLIQDGKLRPAFHRGQARTLTLFD